MYHKFLLERMINLYENSNDEFHSRMTVDEIIRVFIKKLGKRNPGVRQLIRAGIAFQNSQIKVNTTKKIVNDKMEELGKAEEEFNTTRMQRIDSELSRLTETLEADVEQSKRRYAEFHNLAITLKNKITGM